MWQVLGRFAIGWGAFLALPCLVLLFALDRGTAEFTVTVLTFVMGIFMVLAGATVMVFAKHREQGVASRESGDRRRTG